MHRMNGAELRKRKRQSSKGKIEIATHFLIMGKLINKTIKRWRMVGGHLLLTSRCSLLYLLGNLNG